MDLAESLGLEAISVLAERARARAAEGGLKLLGSEGLLQVDRKADGRGGAEGRVGRSLYGFV